MIYIKYQALLGFLKKHQNLKMSSAANLRRCFEGFGGKTTDFILIAGNKNSEKEKDIVCCKFLGFALRVKDSL